MNNFLHKTEGWKLPALAVFALVFTGSFMLSKPDAVASDSSAEPTASPYSSSTAGIGVVEPKSELINLGVELPGVVRKVSVAVGDTVKKDDPLFSLDQREVEAQIATLEASLASARIQAKDSADQYAIVAAMKDKRAISKDDFNRRRNARDLGDARVKEIAAQLTQARTTRDRLTVRAPIDGTILEVNVRPGEFASAGVLETPLMRMGDTSALHVRVEVDEENAANITKEGAAKAFRRGDPLHALPLTFVRFEPYVRPKQNLAVSGQRVDTRVLQIVYAINEPTASTLIGQQLDVFIEQPSKPAE